MKICGLITAISIGILPAYAARLLDLSSNTSTPSALELPIPTYCNASSSWLPPRLSANDLYNDCYRVTLQLLRILHVRGRETYEFHAAGVQPSHGGIHAETTPLKFTHKSCSILITNLHNHPRDWLPPFAWQTYPSTDVASYYDVYEAVDNIMRTCMHAKTPKRLGWAIQGHPASVGAHGAIGVFLIGKGSDFDRAVPIGVRVRDD